MKSKTYIMLGLGIILLLGNSYAQNETTKDKDMVISFLNETTVEVVTTTTTATTTTSMESTTTTSTKDTTSTTAKSTTTTQPKTTSTKKKTCNTYCKNLGYDGGDCRLNGLECRVRNEVKSVYGGRLCPTRRLDACCCQTDKSLEFDSKYSYAIDTPIEPLIDNTVSKTIKTTTTDNSVPTAKGETAAKIQEYIDADLEGE
jgi:hypothetical protein